MLNRGTSHISVWDGNIAVSRDPKGVWLCILRSGASVYLTLEPAQAAQLADALRAAIVNTEPAQGEA